MLAVKTLKPINRKWAIKFKYIKMVEQVREWDKQLKTLLLYRDYMTGLRQRIFQDAEAVFVPLYYWTKLLCIPWWSRLTYTNMLQRAKHPSYSLCLSFPPREMIQFTQNLTKCAYRQNGWGLGIQIKTGNKLACQEKQPTLCQPGWIITATGQGSSWMIWYRLQ